MTKLFFAYGEGQFGTTATGIASGLLALVILLALLGVYASKTYPSDPQGARKRDRN
ncbi:hypothetical protein IQ255_20700 [Pleurocapsales cyanobacterium LEGE 10410]|nr:hypothetical protein [Pleurocapsales cyanobacterium LEGE 10410]